MSGLCGAGEGERVAALNAAEAKKRVIAKPPDTHWVILPDGRRLAYAEYGDPAGAPVLVFHGMPGSRFQRHPDASIAWTLGPVAAAIAHLAKRRPARFIELSARQLDPSDQAILARPAVRTMLEEDLAAAFQQGPRGPLEDFILTARPWEVPLGRAASEIAFWHGTDDRLVPPSASDHLAQVLANATVRRVPAAGHFLVIDCWREILGWLLREA